MVDLRSKTHGPGATTGVNLVVLAYRGDTGRTDDGAAAHLLDARVHPGDRRAPGETDLALVSRRAAAGSESDHRVRYTEEQFASIRRAAGANACDLIGPGGERVGRAYGVRADLLVDSGELVVNTKTLGVSDLSVGPDAEGNDIRAQIDASTRAAGIALDALRASGAFGARADAEVLVGRG